MLDFVEKHCSNCVRVITGSRICESCYDNDNGHIHHKPNHPLVSLNWQKLDGNNYAAALSRQKARYIMNVLGCSDYRLPIKNSCLLLKSAHFMLTNKNNQYVLYAWG